MSDSINLGMMQKSEMELRASNPDRTIDKPFCIQADDEHGMFRFIVRSKVSKNKGGE